MKPSARNKIQSEIKIAQRDVETWKKAFSKMLPGSLTAAKCQREIEKAQNRLTRLKQDLKP